MFRVSSKYLILVFATLIPLNSYSSTQQEDVDKFVQGIDCPLSQFADSNYSCNSDNIKKDGFSASGITQAQTSVNSVKDLGTLPLIFNQVTRTISIPYNTQTKKAEVAIDNTKDVTKKDDSE
ncbi:hypothetical protein NTP67_07870 [Providencia rettgeri]|uniref:hypothetical protein n=1 Tax=Providencia rettgeri TaxID=587 RepID=UPI002220662C|nr:hypothetical protein [Providencia rettgeri]UYV43154.1 hypothetical protein NTP67_07870 [Providencia rettgeri]